MPVGRPSKLTPEMQQRIVERLAAGCYFDVACESAGIHKATAYRWLQEARDALAVEQEHGQAVPENREAQINFLHAVDVASATAEVAALSTLRQGNPNWQAQAWFLERRYPQRWRRRDTIAVDMSDKPRTEPLDEIRRELADMDWDQVRAEMETWQRIDEDDDREDG